MRNPDGGLDGAGGGVLEGALDELLAGLGLDVFELVVDVVEEVGRGERLGFDVADGAVEVVDARAERVRELVEGVGFVFLGRGFGGRARRGIVVVGVRVGAGAVA